VVVLPDQRQADLVGAVLGLDRREGVVQRHGTAARQSRHSMPDWQVRTTDAI